MSDAMRTLPFDALFRWILQEQAENESIFGIHSSLFYRPKKNSVYASEMFGHYLATPIGPAAGPHTQLAQNIVCAWLSGGRFIELKTAQIMDELEIPRPCIEMEDEGYNVEWSQELKLDQSANEYITAWVLIHLLHRLLGFEGQDPVGTVFNLSVGYDLAGVQSAPMTRFLDRMENATDEIAAIRGILQKQFPQFADVEIPTRIADNVTLSTMHGCPPDEIERIARYLLEERGLHTIVKLNPTLLGKETVMRILHDELGYNEIHIPDAVFEHDLQYGRAVELIRTLDHSAAGRGMVFGIKLSNTLAVANHKSYLPGNEMYMSGRALYPITMNLFRKLAEEFGGDLNVSYSAGADALNVAIILAAGARPVTAASDLLKPGGYSRLLQYLETLEAEMRDRQVGSLGELAQDKLANLETAAAEALQNPRYRKSYFRYGPPKVESGLDRFDCITAPCVEQCAVLQDVPAYAWLIAQREYDRALEVILSRNPLPAVTGYVCTHLCQTRCTRNSYDEPVAIRALKRFACEHGSVAMPPADRDDVAPRRVASDRKVAVIGSGPSGLAAASFLALNGVQVTIFEAKEMAGGMLAIAPRFRLPPAVVRADIERITRMGVRIELFHPITAPPEELLKDGFEAVYVACGFQKDARLNIAGMEGTGVLTALDLLHRAARGEQLDLGPRVLVIGGGNTAMDAARTAQRLIGKPVTVVYRRTEQEMPATEEERAGLFVEGNVLEELASPTRVVLRHGRVAALECVRNVLGDPDPDGRRKPIQLEGSEFTIEADSIILAIGQRPDIAFLDGSSISLHQNGAIAADADTGSAGPGCVYAGGDAVRGPAIIIDACADGRRAAEAICSSFGIQFEPMPAHPANLSEKEIRQVKRVRARKEPQHKPKMLPLAKRDGFALIEQTLTERAALNEAARCMQCATFCDKCVEVCPNRANFFFFVTPMNLTLPLLSCGDGKLKAAGEEPFKVEQARQIIHIDDFCNECGNCATFCVHHGKPYAEKPRLFLGNDEFELQDDNAFYIDGDTIRQRNGGEESQLSVSNGTVIFTNPHVHISLSPAFDIHEMALRQEFEGILSLKQAAEMALILSGIKTSAPFLSTRPPMGRAQ